MKLTQFLLLAKKGLPNIDKIAEGYLNNVKEKNNLLTQEQAEEIVKRKLICEQCPFFSLNAFKDDTEYQKLLGKPFDKESRKGESFCSICGCPEKVKVYSFSANCGLEDYNEEHPENIQPLKWTAFKPNQQ